MYASFSPSQPLSADFVIYITEFHPTLVIVILKVIPFCLYKILLSIDQASKFCVINRFY